MNPREHIIKLLKEIEEEQGFDILFAVESGSRLWGMANEKSDYDVRFVYFYPKDRYLSLKKPKKVYEKTFEFEKSLTIDIVGFDIFKYFNLLLKSNPNSIDWLFSNINYISYFPEMRAVIPLRDLVKGFFNPFGLAMAYRGIGLNALKKIKKTLSEQIERVPDPNKRIFSLKRFLYVIRGFLNAYFVYHFEYIPPLQLEKTLKQVPINDQLRYDIMNLIENKREEAVFVSYGEVEHIFKFIEQEIKMLKLYETIEKRKVSDDFIKVLDKFIYRILYKTKPF